MDENMKNMMMKMCANMSMEDCQSMMSNMMKRKTDMNNMTVDQSDKIYGTTELKILFTEWLLQIEEEIKSFTAGKKDSTIDEIADHFKLSKESCKIILDKINK